MTSAKAVTAHGAALDVLLQVNSSGEDTQSGLAPPAPAPAPEPQQEERSELVALATHIIATRPRLCLHLRGLVAVDRLSRRVASVGCGVPQLCDAVRDARRAGDGPRRRSGDARGSGRRMERRWEAPTQHGNVGRFRGAACAERRLESRDGGSSARGGLGQDTSCLPLSHLRSTLRAHLSGFALFMSPVHVCTVEESRHFFSVGSRVEAKKLYFPRTLFASVSGAPVRRWGVRDISHGLPPVEPWWAKLEALRS